MDLTRRDLHELSKPALDMAGVRTISSLTAGAFSVSKFRCSHGDAVRHYPQHRILLPLTDTNARRIAIQCDGNAAKELVRDEALWFYPAGTRTRFASTAVPWFHLLWTPDPGIDGRVEPLLPFEDPLIAMAAQAVAREIDNDAPDRLFVESLCSAIVIKLRRHFPPSAQAAAPTLAGMSRERLRRIVDYIDANLGNDLTLEAIAAVACLSPHHLSRSFRRATGVGLHRYVVQRRIDRAKHLVLQTDLPMAQIAWTVGFESQAAFTTRFRQEFGRPPSQFRRAG